MVFEKVREILAKELRVYDKEMSKEDSYVKATIRLNLEEGDANAKLKAAVESLSGGKNTVVFDTADRPSIMVRTLYRDADGEHEILVGKYQSSLYERGPVSLPLEKPMTGLSYDLARNLAQMKGEGWVPMPLLLRMQIGLKCRENGFLPHGANHKGEDYFHPDEKGILTEEDTILTGSGPATFAHDNTPSGVFDMNGNVNEFDYGVRLVDGEINVIPVMKLFAGADDSADSSDWQAIREDGSFVAPGSEGTMKFDLREGAVVLSKTVDWQEAKKNGADEETVSKFQKLGNCGFSEVMAVDEGNIVPEYLVENGLYPDERRDGYAHGWRWVATEGEVFPSCGGAKWATYHASVFFVGFSRTRDSEYHLGGLRLAYVEK